MRVCLDDLGAGSVTESLVKSASAIAPTALCSSTGVDSTHEMTMLFSLSITLILMMDPGR